MEHIRTHWQSVLLNLTQLGRRRAIALAIIGLSLVAIVVGASYTLSRPNTDILYANLDKADIGRIGSALHEQGIRFDVGSNGTSIYVPVGQGPRARMLLAERGLPSSSATGYELFDKMGSLGMTSFMQEVTRLRAIEGELARTIQLIRGVKAARVHIVLADEGSFRRAKQPASASVIVRTDQSTDAKFPTAIRHLVSAAVPGMKAGQVTIIHSDGTILSSQDDETEQASGRARWLEKSVSTDITESIRRTMAPYLSISNFQVSVAVRLNTDKRHTIETTYDPDTRVERSVKITRESQASSNANQSGAVTVERNIPTEPTRQSQPTRQSNDESQRREELTNYELSSKTVQSTSGGYSIENISVALLINRTALTKSSSSESNNELIDKQLTEIELLVASAAGLRKERGDIIKVSAVEFAQLSRDMEPVGSPGLIDRIIQQIGSIINALAAILIAVILIIFVIRPAASVLIKETEHNNVLSSSLPSTPLLQSTELLSIDQISPDSDELKQKSELLEDQRLPVNTLNALIAEDEIRAAEVLRQWIHSK